MTWSQGLLRQVLVDHLKHARKSHYPDAQCVCGWEGPWFEHVDHVARELAEVLAASQKPVVAATDGTREGPLAHFTLNADGTWTQHVDMNPGWDGCPHKEKYLDDEGVAVCTTCGRGGKA